MLKVHTTKNTLIKTDCLLFKNGTVECWWKHKLMKILNPNEIIQIIPNVFELDKNINETMKELKHEEALGSW